MKKIIIMALYIIAAISLFIAVILSTDKSDKDIYYTPDVLESIIDEQAISTEIHYDESYAKNIDDETTKLGLVYNDDQLAYKVLSSIVTQYCIREGIAYDNIYVEGPPLKEDGLWYYPVVVSQTKLKVFYYTGPDGINGYLAEE